MSYTTFPFSGNAIFSKKTDEKLKIVEGNFLYNTIKNYFLNKMKDNKTADNIILFFGSYFDSQYEGNDKREFLNHIAKSDFSTLKSNLNEYQYSFVEKNTNKKVTLNNEIVNSIQEVQIANFLYLNGIDYEYEPDYPYYILMSKKRYTPDFLIKRNGKQYYLEHFGISENGENNKYTKEELEKYKKSINDKIAIHKKHNTKLLYTFSQYNDGKNLLEHLKQLLNENNIELNPRPSQEVLEKLTAIQENKYVSKMVYLICDFINNFKVNGYTEQQFYDFIRTTKSERTKLFLEICRECYLEYQKALVRNNAVDFQDMINEAARALRDVATLKEKLDFKYIIIDEYQDISRQRFDMAQELSKVTNAKIIAVGDDWQSIFAFSGSDVTLFTQFCEKMGYGEELKITRTYRNAQEVIDIAGGFIQKNETQIKKSLISPKHIDDPVIVVSYNDSSKRQEQTARDGGPLHQMAKALEFAIGDIVSKFGDKSSILLIGRYGYDGAQLERTALFSYIEYGNKVKSTKYPNVKIDFLTAHSSKGLGYDNVIIINAKDAVYGFPSKIEDDPVMKLVIKQHNEMEYAEERRLFYVALTRTKNRVYIIAPEKHPSQFVLEIKDEYKNVIVKGDLNPEPYSLITNKVCPLCGYPLQRRYKKGCGMALWICTNEPEVCGFLSNNLAGGKMSIQKCTQCLDGYLVIKTKNGYPFLGCTNYKADGSGCKNTISQKDYYNGSGVDEIIDFSDFNQAENNVELNGQPSNPKTNKMTGVEDIVGDFENQGDKLGEQTTSNNCDEMAELNVCKIIIQACKEMNRSKYYGATMLANFLKGNRPQQLLSAGLNNRELYGSLNKMKTKSIQSLIEYLVDINILYKTKEMYPTIRINNDCNMDNLDIDVNLVREIVELESGKEVKSKVSVPRDESVPCAWEKWTEQEDVQLINEFKRGLPIKEIANIHQRKIGGIRVRLKKHGLID